MNSTLKLFRIFGIDIKLHFSWWFVFALLVWSLYSTFFPQFFPDNTSQTYLFMSIIAALLLFVSVLLHELSHSLVAQAKKIKVESITLFFFGGVAGISDEDMSPKSEFMMAIAGPLFSLVLAAVFYGIMKLNLGIIWNAITFYLYQLNFVLALFNLIPGFPLDGGRAFRAILYWHYKDLKKATKIAVAGGKLFAGILIFLGILQLIVQIGSGLWLIILGGFLYFISGLSYEQVVFKEILGKIAVTELMVKKVTMLNPKNSFAEFAQKYSNSEQEVFVIEDKSFAGILDARRIEKMSPEMQKRINLKEVALPLNTVKGLQKSDNAYTAFKRFSEENLEILPVYDKRKIVGFITRRVLMHRLIWTLKYNIQGKATSKVIKEAHQKLKK